jgi:spermidine synthase
LTGRPELVSEFFDGAGIAQVVDAVHTRAGGPFNFAVVGLGTGALTCRTRQGDALTYFELDPDIIKIARNPKLFGFVSECGAATPVVQGDARLTLADRPDASYDLIFIDAFIGAAIPIHLLTREAMALYLRKVKPHGMIAMHISNYNLELAPVVSGIAAPNGAIMRLYNGGDVQADDAENKIVPKVAVVAREDGDFGVLAASKYWVRIEPDPNRRVWTDDYSNIIGAMLQRIQTRAREEAGK